MDDCPVLGLYPFLMYAVSRYKTAKGAWCWRVHFTRRGELQSRNFHDLKHGSSRRALAAAIAWRNKQLSQIPALTMREFRQQRRSNNTSGVPGVHFIRTKAQPRGSWQARVALSNGRKVHRTFSVRTYGDRVAFKKAVAARRQLLELVDDKAFLRHGTAKRIAAKL